MDWFKFIKTGFGIKSLINKGRCVYYTHQLNKTVQRCYHELNEHCGPKATMEQCIEHLQNRGVTTFSHSQLACIEQYNPKLLTKTLDICGGARVQGNFTLKTNKDSQ